MALPVQFLVGFVEVGGIDFATQRGEKLLERVSDYLQPLFGEVLGAPEDAADAVYDPLTRPIRVNIAEIVARPPKQTSL